MTRRSDEFGIGRTIGSRTHSLWFYDKESGDGILFEWSTITIIHMFNNVKASGKSPQAVLSSHRRVHIFREIVCQIIEDCYSRGV